MPPMDQLPPDVLRLIAERLNSKDLRSLSLTSNRLARVAFSVKGQALRNTIQEIRDLHTHIEDRRRQVGVAVNDLLATLNASEAQASKAKSVNQQAYNSLVGSLVKELVDLVSDLKALRKLAWEKCVAIDKVFRHWQKVRADHREDKDAEFKTKVGVDRETVAQLLKLIPPLDSNLKVLCEALDEQVLAIIDRSKTLAKAMAKP